MDIFVHYIKKRSVLTALFFIAFSVLVLSGCGNGNTPPPGATLTVAPQGPLSQGTSTTSSSSQIYRVTVTDSTGIPVQGVNVNLEGQFTVGENILFVNAQATQPAPVTLFASVTTGDFGYKDFIVSAPSFTIHPLVPPVGVGASANSSGGVLSAATYTYCVTALDAATPQGETTCSLLISATTPTTNSSVTISWSAEAGAKNYNVYGRTGTLPSSLGLLNTSPLGSSILTFTDTGSPTTPGLPPPTSNNTGVSLNSVTGTITATSGPLTSSTTVGF
jgi:hypothetical protein